MSTTTSTTAASSAGAVTPSPSRARRVVTTVARYLLGLPLLVFGLNAFIDFIPRPETPIPEAAEAFAGALAQSGYMMELIGFTLLTVGLLLVINRFVPLALVLFAPFIVNSMAFHLFLEPSGLPPASAFLALELFLAWSYRTAFQPLLTARHPAS